MHQADILGDTPLMRIIKNHSDSSARCESASILLRSQAFAARNSDVEDELHDALQMAVTLGDTDMCRVLISDGKANPYSATALDDDEQLVLKDNKPIRNEETMLQLLRTHVSGD